MKLTYTKHPVNLTRLTVEILSAIGDDFLYVETVDTDINVYVNDAISQLKKDALATAIASHVSVTMQEYCAAKIEEAIAFGNQLVSKMAAENVAMGITQAGKAGDVLSVFTQKVIVPSSTRAISAVDAVQSGSLYVLAEVLQYHIDNIANYSDLSPFITEARLQAFKAEIMDFLT